FLRARKKGTFELPKAGAVVDGENYTSNSRTIKVVEAKGDAYNAASEKAIANENPKEFSAKGRVFVRTLVSKHNAYIGEPIILVQKLYSKERIANITDMKEPSYTGFWKESIDIGDLQLTRETLNGEQYNVVVLQKYILFPQKTGKLEIGPFQLGAVVQIIKTRPPRDQIEQMMYGNKVRYQTNKNLSLKSPVVKLNIKELPAGKPANFNGLVGSFTMEASVDKSELQANDAFNLKIKIKGQGNISLLEIPKPNFPPDFEVYDPKISQKSNTDASGMSGTKTYEYLIIPRNQGDYTIPPVSFSFFNPRLERYQTLSSDTFFIKVGKGTAESFTGVNSSNVNRDEIKYLGKDIHYIMQGNNKLEPIDKKYFNSFGHLLYLIIAPLFAILFIIFYKKNAKAQADTSLMRNKKATKIARKRLKNAKKLLASDNKTGFYEEISKVLWGYISDKFNISLAELSMDTARERLNSKGVNPEIIEEIISILNNCEFARYAPSAQSDGMQQIYDQALKIISKIEKSLK
ncbi:MAG: protein BatD, partial [Bacteroidetes bacterium]